MTGEVRPGSLTIVIGFEFRVSGFEFQSDLLDRLDMREKCKKNFVSEIRGFPSQFHANYRVVNNLGVR
jgi:hypothetical protein